MTVAILHNEVPPDASQDELDVLVQVETVGQALKTLGYETSPVPLSLDLGKTLDKLAALRPAFAFNLVESVGGVGRFIYFAPAMLDHLRIPYTGCNTHALYTTTDKLRTKRLLRDSGLPTPAWATLTDLQPGAAFFPPPCIVKPVCEDASVGLDEDALVADPDILKETLMERSAKYGDCFAEAFIRGREFNLSVLAGERGPEVLPPAEICFVDYPQDKPRIVGYRAKWETTSFEYKHTVRSFRFPDEERTLIERLRQIALRCWEIFGLRGYARVDFRVDENGGVWVLEINANPCISPDSGFVAAAGQAGLTFEQVIKRILRDSWKG